jgi:hypothetical protein
MPQAALPHRNRPEAAMGLKNSSNSIVCYLMAVIILGHFSRIVLFGRVPVPVAGFRVRQ